MTTVGHPGRHRIGKTYWTRSCLGLGRGNDLEDVGPVEVLVCIAGLGGVAAVGIHDESVIRMDKPDKGEALSSAAGRAQGVEGTREAIDRTSLCRQCDGRSPGAPGGDGWSLNGYGAHCIVE